MNREIEFRAIIDGNTHYFSFQSILNPRFSLRQIVIPRLLSGNEPDRYTGLKDKNGTKIFEGDILQNNQEENTVSVYRNTYGGCWEFKEHNIFSDDGHGRGERILNFRFTKNSEVIGNIYENRELL